MKASAIKLIVSASSNTVAGFISKALLIAASIIIARSVDKSYFGAYVFVLSSAYLVSNISAFGLNTYATKLVSESISCGSDVKKLVLDIELIAILLSGLGVLVMFVWSGQIMSGFAEIEGSADLLIYGLVFTFAISMSSVYSAVLLGLSSFKSVARSNLLTATLGFSLQMAALPKYGVLGSILGLGIANLAGVLYMHFRIRSAMKYIEYPAADLILRFQSIKKIVIESLPVFLSSLMVNPVNWFAGYLLTMTPNGASQVASLGLANQWKVAILFVPGILASIAMPKMVSLFNSGNRNELAQFTKINLFVNAVIGAAFVVVAAAASNYLAEIYGPAYRNDRSVFVGMAVISALMILNNVVGLVITCVNRVWIGFGFNFAWACFTMVFLWLFVWKLNEGVFGVVYAFILSYALHCVWQFIFIKNFINHMDRAQ